MIDHLGKERTKKAFKEKNLKVFSLIEFVCKFIFCHIVHVDTVFAERQSFQA